MIRAWIAVLLTLALLPSRASALIESRDTIVDGAPWIAVQAAKRGSTGPDIAEFDLATTKDRGVPSATLKPRKGASWTFWKDNPFAKSGNDLVSTVQAPRFLGKTILIPKSSRPGQLVAKAPRILATPSLVPSVPDSPALVSAVVDTDAAPRQDSVPIETVALGQDEPTAVEVPRQASHQPARISDIDGADGVFTIVIDAGHGGKDPGAIGQKVAGKALQEKDATLGIAQYLRDELRGRKGVRVVMTRDSDVFLSLGERTRVANQADGDLFVSIHCNSLPLNSTRRDDVEGFMVYLLREAKSEEDRAIERRENEAIRFETGERQRKDALSPVEWMLLEHQLNQFTKESERFAGFVVNRLSNKGPVKKERTGAGQAGFFVLVGALMPSVLIETGYLSHPDDAASLGASSGRKAIAKEIARAIDDFRRDRN